MFAFWVQAHDTTSVRMLLFGEESSTAVCVDVATSKFSVRRVCCSASGTRILMYVLMVRYRSGCITIFALLS